MKTTKSLRKRPSFKSTSINSSDSDSDIETEEKETVKNAKEYYKYRVPLSRILKLNIDDWPYILIGCLASIVMGASLPIFAVIFSKFFEVCFIIVKLNC